MKKIFGFALLASLLFSCSTSDDTTTDNGTVDDYSKSILITNEGNFMSANASITSLSTDFQVVENDIFKIVNGTSVGDVAQSIAFSTDLVFIVVNNSNVIQVVNKKDFKSVATISQNLVGPRYALVVNNLLYVTNSNKKVTVYNSNTFELIKEIELSFIPEFIVEANGYIYVSSNFYDVKAAIGVINLSTNEAVVELNVDLAINGFTAANNNVYALATNSDETVIYEINNTSITNSKYYDIANSRYLSFDNGNLFFTANLGIYKLNPSELNKNTVPTEIFKVEDNSWSSLYGFEALNGFIFTSDAKGFTQDSEITIYSETGTKLKTFKAGIGSNGFYKD